MDWTKPQLVKLPTVRDRRGSLTVIENGEGDVVPFTIARAYWIYDIPADALRDGHAMLSQSEILVALAGSFDVAVFTADGSRTFHLDRNYRGLYLPPLTWREISGFSTCSIAFTLSDALYDENDYIRSRSRFEELISTL